MTWGQQAVVFLCPWDLDPGLRLLDAVCECQSLAQKALMFLCQDSGSRLLDYVSECQSIPFSDLTVLDLTVADYEEMKVNGWDMK